MKVIGVTWMFANGQGMDGTTVCTDVADALAVVKNALEGGAFSVTVGVEEQEDDDEDMA